MMMLIALAAATRADALDVRLAWSPPAEAAGYRIYVRQAGATYRTALDLGALPPGNDGTVRTVVSGLSDTATSYLVVSSYTASGVESALSNELSSADAVAVASPTPAPAATPTPTAAATATPEPTRTASPTPPPTATPTPAPPSSGSLVVPLDAWRVLAGNGAWQTAWSADLGSATVRTTSAERTPTDYVVGYPGTTDLGAALRSLTFAVRGSGGAMVQAIVRSTTGRRRTLVYALETGSVTKRASTATFRVGAGDGTTFRTITRDLAADLKLAFGETFAVVDQVRLAGTLEAGNLVLGSSASAPLVSSGLEIPLQGWQVRSGQLFENELDPEIDAPVLRVDPATVETRPMAIYPPPRSGMLVAAYGRLVLMVRAGSDFALDVRVQTGSRGSFRLRYEPGVVEPRMSGGSATLPLAVVPNGDSSYGTIELDLAADLAAAKPDAVLGGVQQIRVRGGFRAAAVVAGAPLGDAASAAFEPGAEDEQ